MSKQNVTISRYDGSVNWKMAIQPEGRQWILFVDAQDNAYLYERFEDVEDAATGETRERYVIAARPAEARMPEPFVAGEKPSTGNDPRLTILVAPTTDPRCAEPFVAVCGSTAGMGKTRRAAIMELMDQEAPRFDGSLVLAL